MRDICHRCGGELAAADSLTTVERPTFCPHCGAPQLLLSDYTEPLSTGMEGPAGPSTGTLPPPRPNQIDWRMALSLAAIVAAVGAVLSAAAAQVQSLAYITIVWVVSGSLTTLAMYQRRRPAAYMNARIGAKIGILVGIILAFVLGATLSVGMAVARYRLHTMADFDSQTVQMFHDLKLRMDQAAAANPGSPAVSFPFDSVEFRTGMSLASYGMILVGVFVISIFGGAVGGLLRRRRFVSKA